MARIYIFRYYLLLIRFIKSYCRMRLDILSCTCTFNIISLYALRRLMRRPSIEVHILVAFKGEMKRLHKEASKP